MSDGKVCIIGAGASGISAAKAFAERGIDYDCFDRSDRVGGNWVYQNSNGTSASYSTLHINTSRQRMEFSDFPMPEYLPDFARHDQVAQYFDDYVDHFGIRDSITFGIGVEHVAPQPDGTFSVTLSTGEVRHYSAVVVGNGHHWDPRWPEPAFDGAETFAGEQMHAHSYTSPDQLAGKRVVVVGLGNSAVDIAVDASYYASSAVLSVRSGAHVIPKYVFGRPYDQPLATEWIPSGLRWMAARPLMRLSTGPMTRYGLPKPDHKFATSHPTMSTRVLDRLAHGAIAPKPVIERLDGGTVHFADGSSAEADLIIYCTGYKISFPFFDHDLIDPREDNKIPLYQRVFSPTIPNLYFIGLVQPLGAVMPICERQSQLVADHLTGRYRLPDATGMAKEIGRYEQSLRRRYKPTKRHTLQIDFDDYMRDLRVERIKGRLRRHARAS